MFGGYYTVAKRKGMIFALVFGPCMTPEALPTLALAEEVVHKEWRMKESDTFETLFVLSSHGLIEGMGNKSAWINIYRGTWTLSAAGNPVPANPPSSSGWGSVATANGWGGAAHK